MAQKSNEKKSFKVVINGSGGVEGRITHGKKPYMTSIINYRILPDGSLKKRPGYQKIYSGEETIRAVWSGNIKGKFACFFLAGSNVFNIDLSSGIAVSRGNVGSSDGKAEFFYFHDRLYLADGTSIYEITERSPVIISGYVPLFGKDWPTGVAGEINEPLNILNLRARITYKAEATSVPYLCPKYQVKSIDAVYKNGVLMEPDSYAYNETANLIRVNGIDEGDRFEINVTYESNGLESLRSTLSSCRSASVFGGINTSRVFLWNGSKKNTIFTSSYVPRSSLAESLSRYPDSSLLYFMAGEEFFVGDGRYNVTAIARHYDRLLIFTDGDAWMADSSTCGTEEFPVMTINSNVGCCVTNGALTANNDPITISKSGIYRWHSNTDELNDCNAYCISDAISPMMSESLYESGILYFDRTRNELWIHEGKWNNSVWIYNFTLKVWTRYWGIDATHIFDANGNVGFTNENSIFVFDELLEKDICDGMYTTIPGHIETSIIDFEGSEYKKIKSFTFRGSSEKSNMTFILSTDRGEDISIPIRENGDHLVIKIAARSHRLQGFSCWLHDDSTGPQTIHELVVELK